MTWPSPSTPSVSRTGFRPAVLVRVIDAVTGGPPYKPPTLRLRQVDPATGALAEVGGPARLTAGGAVVFSRLDTTGPAVGTVRQYRLDVEADPVSGPEQAGGYPITVPADPAVWPVEVAVVLLPGPAYPYAAHIPVLRGQVLRAPPDGSPVAGAVVTVTENVTGAVVARAAADHLGRYTAGVPRYRATRAISAQPVAPDGATGTIQQLADDDFRRSVDLTIP